MRLVAHQRAPDSQQLYGGLPLFRVHSRCFRLYKSSKQGKTAQLLPLMSEAARTASSHSIKAAREAVCKQADPKWRSGWLCSSVPRGCL